MLGAIFPSMHTCKDTQWSVDTFIENCIPTPHNCFEQIDFALAQLLFLFHKGYFYYCNISLICNREEEYRKAHCWEQTNNSHIYFQLLCLSAGTTMWGDLEERGVMCLSMQMIKLSCPQHTHNGENETIAGHPSRINWISSVLGLWWNTIFKIPFLTKETESFILLFW